MAHLYPTLSGSSNVGAIPLQDLRNAIRPVQNDDCAECDAPLPPRPLSRMHNFVATDNGIVNGFVPNSARSA